MPAFVPSQIVVFMDERFPSAKAQAEGGPGSEIPRDYAGALAHLIFMIDHLPEHLVTLRGPAYAEFGEATEAARIVVAAWHAGDQNQQLRPLVGKNGWSPLAFIRKHVATLSDEGPSNVVTELAFIHDLSLRHGLATDLQSVENSLERGAWKAATILGGSGAEALLLAALLSRETEARKAASASALPDPLDLTKWTLNNLTEVAVTLKVIEELTAAQCRVARNFRNLIHPGRALRLAQTCDRGTAYAAVAAVELVIRDLRSASSP